MAYSKPLETQTFKGSVESIALPSGMSSGNKAELTAVDHKGQRVTFEARSGQGVDVTGTDRAISLKEVNIGDKVIIEYTITKYGSRKITAMECSKPRRK